MELQFQSDSCQCLKAEIREVRDAELTQEVRLSDGMPDIGRVLASWGQPVLRSKEWQGDRMAVSGGVMMWILYAPADGTPPRCVDAWVPFQLKWELADAGKEGPIRVYPLLRFTDSRGISARKMMIRAGIAAMVEALSTAQTKVYRPSEMPEDVQLLQNTYPVRIAKEAGEKTYLLDEDAQLPSNVALPERLLGYTMLPQVFEKRVVGDKLILRGNGKLWLVYRCADEKIHTVDLEVPIAQYVQLDDTYGNDAQADVIMGVTSLELLHNEGMQIRMKCGMVAQYLITDRYLAEVTEDAYSTRRDVGLKTEELVIPAILEQRTDVIQVNQPIPGMDADVVGINFLPDFPHQSRNGDVIALELSAQLQLLYYASDGSLQGSTVRWEGTMKTTAAADCSISFLVQPNGNIQVTPGAEGLSLAGQIKLEMYTQLKTKIPMVLSLDLGHESEPNPNRPSLVLLRSEGESLWTIAKQCGSTVEEILRANHLDGQPQRDQMLLVPIL